MMRAALTRHLRALSRLGALALLTAGLYLFWLAGRPAAALFAAGPRRWRAFNFRAWARAAAAVCGMRIKVEGLPPRGPFLLVSNHLGYMDVVALAARLDCVFVAKSEVAAWPVVGRLCRGVGTIFVDRRRRASLPPTLARIGRALAEGSGVVLFAEGTSTRGRSVAPFKPSLLEAAARLGVPVHYASLGYRTPPPERSASLSVCWWGGMTFPGHFYELCQLSGFEARVAFGGGPICGSDRKALARSLWAAVSAQFVPVC